MLPQTWGPKMRWISQMQPKILEFCSVWSSSRCTPLSTDSTHRCESVMRWPHRIEAWGKGCKGRMEQPTMYKLEAQLNKARLFIQIKSKNETQTKKEIIRKLRKNPCSEGDMCSTENWTNIMGRKQGGAALPPRSIHLRGYGILTFSKLIISYNRLSLVVFALTEKLVWHQTHTFELNFSTGLYRIRGKVVLRKGCIVVYRIHGGSTSRLPTNLVTIMKK